MPDTATAATSDTFTFHEDPILRTATPDSDRPWETEDVPDLNVSFCCALDDCDTTIGWAEREYGVDRVTYDWHPYAEVQLANDNGPTRFCEDCTRWLTTAAALFAKAAN